jgi:hypothetical protein
MEQAEKYFLKLVQKQAKKFQAKGGSFREMPLCGKSKERSSGESRGREERMKGRRDDRKKVWMSAAYQ